MEENLIDFGKTYDIDSLSFEPTTPSLLNLNIDPNTSLSMFDGRESLGILNNSFIEKELSPNTFSDLVNDFDFHHIDYLTSDTKLTIDSNIISKIFTVSSSGSTLNNAILYENSFNVVSPFSHLTVPKARPRLKSLPTELFKNKPLLQTVAEAVSESNAFKMDASKKNNGMIDIMCIEARYIADKIADGSIFEDSGEGGSCINLTAEPNFKDISEQDVSEKYIDNDDVFKSVDKMLPPTTILSSSEPVPLTDSNRENQSTEEAVKDSVSSTNVAFCNVCKDFLMIAEKTECQSFQVTNIKDVLSKLTNIAESNVMNEDSLNECYVSCLNFIHLVANCQTKPKENVPVNANKIDTNGVEGSDLKLKLSYGTKSSKENNKPSNVDKKGTTLKTLIQNDVKEKPLKLKTKKIGDLKSSLNRGPMKAIAPITNCLKPDDGKMSDTSSKVVSHARNSTPCRSRLKPLAQSTPEYDRAILQVSDNSLKNDMHSPISRRNSSNPMRHQPDENSSSCNNSSNALSKSLSRRVSTSDLKRDNASRLIKRSNSIGDSTAAAAAVRARELASNRIAQFQQNNSLKKTNNTALRYDNNQKIGLTENKRIIKANLKPFSLISKLKIGKENAAP